MTPFRLEKWYLDVVGDDGTLLIVTLGELRLGGLRRARLAAELHRPDGTTVRDTLSLAHFRRTSGGCTFAAGGLEPDGLAWRAPGLSGSVRLVPRFPAFTPADPLLATRRRSLRWTVEIPDADAAVDLTWPTGRLALGGRAYCDRVLLDAMPWRLGLRRLAWGHAVFPTGATWWLELVTRRHTIAATWRDGVLSAGCAPPALEPARTLGDYRVVDLPVLRIPPLGTVVRWLAGDPHQQRWLARAVGAERGWSVHELVRWRAGDA